MSERTIECGWCRRRNRVPQGLLVEAACGRCQSALTYYTWIAPAVRAGGVRRGIQVVAGAAAIAVLLGPPLLEWWETEPFRLTDRPAAETDAVVSLASPVGGAPLE